MASSKPPRELVFFCVGCGQRCIADTKANTVRHQLPTCAIYKRASALDFIVMNGVGAEQGSAALKGGGR